MTPRQPLHWTVDRFENGYAVLIANKQEWLVPRVQIPASCKEGDILTAEFYLQKDEKKRKENIARAVLAEILGETDSSQT